MSKRRKPVLIQLLPFSHSTLIIETNQILSEHLYIEYLRQMTVENKRIISLFAAYSSKCKTTSDFKFYFDDRLQTYFYFQLKPFSNSFLRESFLFEIDVVIGQCSIDVVSMCTVWAFCSSTILECFNNDEKWTVEKIYLNMRASTCLLMMIISKINSQLVYHNLSVVYTWHRSDRQMML